MTSAPAGDLQVKEPRLRFRDNRDFSILWMGLAVSELGSQVSRISYPLLVLALYHSPAQAGLVGFAATLPLVAWPLPAGVLVDRRNRKRLMIACDVGRGIALALLAATLLLDAKPPLALIAAVAFVDGTLTVFFGLCERAALRRVVRPSQLPAAVARNEAREYAGFLAGPPIGGALFGLARSVPFLVDAVSYLASVAGLSMIRSEFQEPRAADERRSLRAEAAEGFVWLWRHAFLRWCALLIAGSNFVTNGLILVLIVVAKDMGTSSAGVGLLLSSVGIGGLVGALAAGRLQELLPPRVVVIGEPWVKLALIPLLAFAPDTIVLGLAFAAMLSTGPTWNAVVVGYRLSVVPDRLQGRVQSVASLLSMSVVPLGPLVGGYLAQAVGGRTTILVFGAWMLFIAVLASLVRPIRTFDPRGAFATGV